MSFVYKIEQLDLTTWLTSDEVAGKTRSLIKEFVHAALEIRANLPEFSNWDGYGEYWLAPLPMRGKFLVIVRPNANPFAEGILVSPIALPMETAQ